MLNVIVVNENQLDAVFMRKAFEDTFKGELEPVQGCVTVVNTRENLPGVLDKVEKEPQVLIVVDRHATPWLNEVVETHSWVEDVPLVVVLGTGKLHRQLAEERFSNFNRKDALVLIDVADRENVEVLWPLVYAFKYASRGLDDAFVTNASYRQALATCRSTANFMMPDNKIENVTRGPKAGDVVVLG